MMSKTAQVAALIAVCTLNAVVPAAAQASIEDNRQARWIRQVRTLEVKQLQ